MLIEKLNIGTKCLEYIILTYVGKIGNDVLSLELEERCLVLSMMRCHNGCLIRQYLKLAKKTIQIIKIIILIAKQHVSQMQYYIYICCVIVHQSIARFHEACLFHDWSHKPSILSHYLRHRVVCTISFARIKSRIWFDNIVICRTNQVGTPCEFVERSHQPSKTFSIIKLFP